MFVKTKFLKRLILYFVVLFFCFNNYAVLISDASAFVTKSEFTSEINNLSQRMEILQNSIDSKIDQLISTYLTRNGIWSGLSQQLNSSFTENKTVKGYRTPFPYLLNIMSGSGLASARGLQAQMADNILGTVLMVPKVSKTGLAMFNAEFRRVDGSADIRNCIYWAAATVSSGITNFTVNNEGFGVGSTKSVFYGFDIATDSDFTKIIDSYDKSDLIVAKADEYTTSIGKTYCGFSLVTDRDMRRFFVTKDDKIYIRERFNFNLTGYSATKLWTYGNIQNNNSNLTAASALFYYIYSFKVY